MASPFIALRWVSVLAVSAQYWTERVTVSDSYLATCLALVKGGRLVVGAENPGIVFVFDDVIDASGPGPLKARRNLTSKVSGDQFGFSCATDGDVLVVGAPNTASAEGRVYVYDDFDESERRTLLEAPIRNELTYFGGAVAVSGALLVVGAHGTTGSSLQYGNVYTYRRNSMNGGWESDDPSGQPLTPADVADSNGVWFGYALALSGSVLIVGAPREDDNERENKGAVHVYSSKGVQGWIQVTKLPLSRDDLSGHDNFGFSISFDGDFLVVGAPYEDHGKYVNPGAAFVYEMIDDEGNQWQQRYDGRLVQPETHVSNWSHFGTKVAVSDRVVAVTAPGESTDGSSGAVYVFSEYNASECSSAVQRISPEDYATNIGWSVTAEASTVVVGTQPANIETLGGTVSVFEAGPTPPLENSSDFLCNEGVSPTTPIVPDNGGDGNGGGSPGLAKRVGIAALRPTEQNLVYFAILASFTLCIYIVVLFCTYCYVLDKLRKDDATTADQIVAHGLQRVLETANNVCTRFTANDRGLLLLLVPLNETKTFLSNANDAMLGMATLRCRTIHLVTLQEEITQAVDATLDSVRGVEKTENLRNIYVRTLQLGKDLKSLKDDVEKMDQFRSCRSCCKILCFIMLCCGILCFIMKAFKFQKTHAELEKKLSELRDRYHTQGIAHNAQAIATTHDGVATNTGILRDIWRSIRSIRQNQRRVDEEMKTAEIELPVVPTSISNQPHGAPPSLFSIPSFFPLRRLFSSTTVAPPN